MRKRQIEIIDKALTLIDAGGIQNLTIRKLASEMDITEPAIYRHFIDKQDLLLNIIKYSENRINMIFEQIPDNEKDHKQILDIIYRAHLTLFKKNRAISAVVFSEEFFRSSPACIEAARDMLINTERKIECIIRNAQRNGHIRNDLTPEFICFMYMSVIRFLIRKWRLTEYEYDIEQRGNEYLNQLKLMIFKTTMEKE